MLPLDAASLAAVDALRQIDGWPREHVAVARRPARRGDARRRATAVRVGVGDEARAAPSRCWSPPRRGSSTSTSRAAHRDRRSATCSPTPRGCRSSGRARRPARCAAGLFEHGFERGCARRRARRDAVRRLLRARVGGHRRIGWTARRARARPARSAICRARPRAARAHAARARDARGGRTVQFPGLDGVLPGFGRQEPNDWGLGLELRDGKSPHWTGSGTRPQTFGHFGAERHVPLGRPRRGIALGCLTDLEFGDWAVEAWPRLADAVLAGVGRLFSPALPWSPYGQKR